MWIGQSIVYKVRDIYSGYHSNYLQMNRSWHAEDAPWKAAQIFKMMKKHHLNPRTIVEVGCGVGEILYVLNEKLADPSIRFYGYDIAPDAIRIAQSKKIPNLQFFCEDFLKEKGIHYDLLLMIDVFEHVPDYIGFIEATRNYADYKIYHIPLDVHLSGVLRNQLLSARRLYGHLHYFTKDTALATLREAGLEIIDFFYTPVFTQSSKMRTRIANLPRLSLFPIFPDLTVKLFGGYSLLVLAK